MKLDDFIVIEEKYNANQLEFKGFSYWTYNRMYIYLTYIFSNRTSNMSNRGKRECVREVILRIGELCKNGMRNEPLRKKDILVLNSPRKIRIEQEYECIYTSELARNLHDYIIFEYPYNGKHFFPTVDKHIRFMDGVELGAFVYYRICRLSTEYDEYRREVVKTIEKIVVEINQKMDVSIDVNEVAEWMTNSYFMYRYNKFVLSKYLKRINPKLILEVDSNSFQAMIINEIAKEKNIITVELQHGVMGKEHISYNYPAAIKVKQYPDYIFTFFDSIMNGARIPLEADRLIATGYPYFERAISKYPKRKIDDKIRIVFVSQRSIGKELAQLAVKLSDIICHDKYEIIYVLHPKEYSMWKEQYTDLVENGITVVGDSTTSIYEYLSIADIAVGVFSTALMEGLAFDLKTFLYNIEGVGYFEDFIKEGYMKLFDDEHELLHCIEEYSAHESQIKIDFWKRNALQNMQSEIRKLMERK